MENAVIFIGWGVEFCDAYALTCLDTHALARLVT